MVALDSVRYCLEKKLKNQVSTGFSGINVLGGSTKWHRNYRSEEQIGRKWKTHMGHLKNLARKQNCREI